MVDLSLVALLQESPLLCANICYDYYWSPKISEALILLEFQKANKGTRTPDPRITNALLYQLSHIGMTNQSRKLLYRILKKMQLFFSEIYNKIYRNSIDILFIEYKMFCSLFIISKLFVTIQYFSGLEACGMDIGKRMK